MACLLDFSRAELLPFRPKAIAALGSGAWPEVHALTRGPGPGFACCGSAVGSTRQNSALSPPAHCSDSGQFNL